MISEGPRIVTVVVTTILETLNSLNSIDVQTRNSLNNSLTVTEKIVVVTTEIVKETVTVTTTINSDCKPFYLTLIMTLSFLAALIYRYCRRSKACERAIDFKFD